MTSHMYKAVIGFLLSIPSVFANNPFEVLFPVLRNVFILASFSWLGPQYRPHAAKAIFFIVFLVLIDWALRNIIEEKHVRGVIAFAISAISIIFMPDEISLFAGNQYAVVAGALMVGGIPGALIWQGWRWTHDFEDSKRKIARAAVLFIALLVVNGLATLFGAADLSAGWLVDGLSLMNGIILLFFLGYFFLAIGILFGGTSSLRAAGDTGRSLNNAARGLDQNLRQSDQEDAQVETLTRQQRNIDRKEITDVYQLEKELLRIEKDLAKIVGLNKPETAKKKKADKKDIQRQLNKIERTFRNLVEQEKRERDILKNLATLERNRGIIHEDRKHKIDLILNTLNDEEEYIRELEQLLTQVFGNLSSFFNDGKIEHVHAIHKYVADAILPLAKKLIIIKQKQDKIIKQI
ncbi:MAG: hypothetical protein ACMXYK_02280 [Candidatus Woesearchaeota archaeon]